MSAKEMTVFFPGGFEKANVLQELVEGLALSVDSLPAGFPYEFSAQRRDGQSSLLIEYDDDPRDVIGEIGKWERPSGDYKRLLADCRSGLVIHYRNQSDASRCLRLIAKSIEPIVTRSIVDNGLGCLLLLSDVVALLERDSSWSWEREEFPELVDVAVSEWLE